MTAVPLQRGSRRHPSRPRRATSPARQALIAATSGLAWSTGASALLRALPRWRRLERSNFHGRTVSLRGGIASAIGATAVAGCAGALARPNALTARPGAAAVIAASAGGTAGLIDDLDAGAHDGDAPAKGLAGHLGALARGRVTTGALKIAIIGSGALVGGVLLARHRAPAAPAARPRALVADAAVSAIVIGAWANVHNLLDLRPGRALKASALISAPLLAWPGQAAAPTRILAAGALGVAAASAPEDLGERTMLGDTGANSLGALVGAALAAAPSRAFRHGAAVAGAALILASERVSFSRVIDSSPALAALDALGRRDQ
ncbi:hypothetical protein [Actinomyces gaoshouyii]|uniref:hypothetical protein n=1 Tax=Actinomyces gaoshouyii TaxID=1960083 RepID=UPI0009BD4E0D|nr:hypothetical protein [Actinomyces gaoshouyii]ARD41557.1 hypothetical protein B6G06_03675 [Actinomyces gaoshouyii]